MAEDSLEAVRFAMEQMWNVIREQKKRMDQMEVEMAQLRTMLTEQSQPHLLPTNALSPK
jgi:hypothetical protein